MKSERADRRCPENRFGTQVGTARQPSPAAFFYPDPAAIVPTPGLDCVGLDSLIYTVDARPHSSFRNLTAYVVSRICGGVHGGPQKAVLLVRTGLIDIPLPDRGAIVGNNSRHDLVLLEVTTAIDLGGRQPPASLWARLSSLATQTAERVWLSLNFDPEIAYDNEAMWRRLHAIPLLRRFTGKNRDNDLESKLANELPSILNWLIEGAQRYAHLGLGNCAQVTDAIEKLRVRSDTVRSWFTACCVKREAGDIQRANDVYTSYVAYTRNGNRSPLPKPKFNARLQKLGAQQARRSEFNGWKGFVLRAD